MTYYRLLLIALLVLVVTADVTDKPDKNNNNDNNNKDKDKDNPIINRKGPPIHKPFKIKPDNRFEKRSLNYAVLSILKINAVVFRSLQSEGSNDSPNWNGDYMYGAIYIQPALYPTSFLAFSSKRWNVSIDEGIIELTIEKTATYIASSFFKITERTKNGTIVSGKTLDFSKVTWSYLEQESDNLTNKGDGIYAFVFDADLLFYPFVDDVSLVYILTQTAGELLDDFNGLIVPQALESMVTISGWKYENQSNYLALELAVACDSSQWTSDGQIVSTNTSINQSSYFRLSNEVMVSGSFGKVNILTEKGKVQSIFKNLSYVVTQLTTRYSTTAEAWSVTVEFPAGADNIIYDPTLGVGDSPFQPAPSPPPSDNTNLNLIIGLSVGCGSLLIIIIFVGVYFYRKTDYTRLKE